jgi:hypothetical protein
MSDRQKYLPAEDLRVPASIIGLGLGSGAIVAIIGWLLV